MQHCTTLFNQIKIRSQMRIEQLVKINTKSDTDTDSDLFHFL